VVFAGTSTKLYQLSNTDFSWTDVSKGGGSYTALPSSDHWQFAQFGNLVIAVIFDEVEKLSNKSRGAGAVRVTA
jgi:hypothetical protein